MNEGRQLRILIGTPCGNGQVTVQYMLSLMTLFSETMKIKHHVFVRDNLRKAKAAGIANADNLKNLAELEAMNLIDIEIGIYTLSNESLLTRGRNHIAAVAMRQGWDKLFFIDADAQFSYKDFISVALAPYDFVAGACPLKCFPISLNYLPFEEDEHYYRGNMRSVDSLLKLREGHKSQYVPVAFIGTAFMCLSRKVLLALAEVADEYQYPNPSTQHLHTHWNIFATKPMNGKFMSEDWYACHMARELGFKVMLDTNVIISHVGNHVFSPDQAQITHIKTEGIATT